MAQSKVDYVIIGVSGINYYAKDARQILGTADYDLFIRPTTENILNAILCLTREGYHVTVPVAPGRWKGVTKPSRTLCERLADEKRTLVAEGFYHQIVEGLLEISGFTFEEIKNKAVWMKDAQLRFRFPVASMRHLLESKRAANREKDRHFLAKYKSLLKEFY
jgi:hypothetical protein